MIHNLFDIKIYKKKFPGDLRKLQERIIPQLDKFFKESADNNEQSMRDGGICCFNVYPNMHKQIDMQEITDFVQSSSTEYWKELRYMEARTAVNHAWANIYPPRAYIDRHNHIPSILSTSFYLKKPINSGNIIFENPNREILRYQPYIGLHEPDQYLSVFDTIIEAEEGDVVELFGENLTISEVAGWLKTISYEVLTSISRRVKRVYFQE